MERDAELLLVWMLLLLVVQQGCHCTKIDVTRGMSTEKIGGHTYLISESPKLMAPNWKQCRAVADYYQYKPIPLWAGSMNGKIRAVWLAESSSEFHLKSYKTQKPESCLIQVRRISHGMQDEKNTVVLGHVIVPVVASLENGTGDVAKAAIFQTLDLRGKQVTMEVLLTADRNEYPLERENERHIQRYINDHPEFKNVVTEFRAGKSKQWHSSSSSVVHEVYTRWMEGFKSKFSLDDILQYCTTNWYSDDYYNNKEQQPNSARETVPFSQKQKDLKLGAHLGDHHRRIDKNTHYAQGAPTASNFGVTTQTVTAGGVAKPQLLATTTRLRHNDNKDHLQQWREYAEKTRIFDENNDHLSARTHGAVVGNVTIPRPPPGFGYFGELDNLSPIVGRGGSYATKQEMLAAMAQINNKHSSSINPNAYNLLRDANAAAYGKNEGKRRLYLVSPDHFSKGWIFGGGGG